MFELFLVALAQVVVGAPDQAPPAAPAAVGQTASPSSEPASAPAAVDPVAPAQPQPAPAPAPSADPAPVPAATAQPATAPQPTQVASNAATDEKVIVEGSQAPKVKCRMEKVLGSNTRKQKICTTERDPGGKDLDRRRIMRDFGTQRANQEPRPSGGG
jgi:hypothetical protein